MPSMLRTITFALFLTSSSLAGQQGPLAPSAGSTPVPDSLAKPIAAAMSPKGVRVAVGKGATLDFWFVSGLPLNGGSGAASWAAVPEGTLVGAVSISSAFDDIRGRVIKPGVYTLRYGIQPENGDHLGVSPFRDFLLLSPASADTDIAPRGHEGTVELSKGAIGGSHPAVLSIDPPSASAAALSLHKTELGHDAVIVEVPATVDGKPAGTLRFGIVLIGKIEA